MQKKAIQYGFQYRDENRGLIVNWYPRKGTVFAQKNLPNIDFPQVCFKETELLAIFENGKTAAPKAQLVQATVQTTKPTTGICSDAGTHGNPGPSEYNLADMNGTILENKHLGVHSNNYAELYGILAGINYCTINKIPELWTDSNVCLIWINSGKVGKTVHERDDVLRIVSEIRSLLEQYSVQLKKWDTKTWGEIPADFGRK